jgi:hypothetical protein
MKTARMIALARICLGCVVVFILPLLGRADTLSDLEVWYRLDEGMSSTANDSSTNGRYGTLVTGATFISNGAVGGAVNLDGSTGYIDCPAIAATNNASKLTVAF